MVHEGEFDAFIAASRKIGMADVKALEAALDDAAALVPGGEAGAPVRAALIDLLKAGQDYVRLEAELEKEEDHG